MAFIDGKKYRTLVDAMKSGDERAKTILIAQYNGDDDKVGELLEEYFSEPETVENEEPVVEEIKEETKPETYEDKMKKFLDDNGVHEGDEEYDSYVEEYKKENPQEDDSEIEEDNSVGDDLDENIKFLLDDELEAVRGYDDVILKVSTMKLGDSERKGLMAELTEIKNDELEHIEKLRRLLEKHSDIDEQN